MYKKYSSYIIFVLGLLYIGMFYFSFIEAKKIMHKYVPLVNATMKIKIETITSHHYLEEMLYGEREQNLQKALEHINKAIFYADTMINSNTDSDSIGLTLEDNYTRNKIYDVLLSLRYLKETTIKRFEKIVSKESISRFRKEYHESFVIFNNNANYVEERINQLIDKEMRIFNYLNIVLFLLSMLTLVVIVVIKRKNEKKYDEFIETIEKQNRLLTELSNTDALTNIANRRYFDAFTNEKFAWAKRMHEPISIIMVDIDYFKNYNDFYGHAEGDKCLQKVALEMKHHLRRPTDLLARYGGEEFVIVLLDTNNVQEFVEKIRLSIVKLEIPHEKSECSDFVTVSIGISTGIPKEDMHPYALLHEADEALYKAKEQGRNRVVNYIKD